MQEREPGAGAAEKAREAVLTLAGRVIDEFGPAVAVAGERAHRLQLERGAGRVQPLDQRLPGGVEPQILRLIDDARAVLEGDDLDRAAVIVRIGKLAFDFRDAPAGTTEQDADRRAIFGEPQQEFAGRVEPLPHDHGDQPQQHRLFLEQRTPAAGFHVGDEAIVERGAGRGRIGRHGGRLARLDEEIIERGRDQLGQLPQQGGAQGGARAVVQRVEDGAGGRRAKPCGGGLDERRKQVFEGARLRHRRRRAVRADRAKPPRSRPRRGPKPAAPPTACGARRTSATPHWRRSSRRAPVATQTATDRRWRSSGTRPRGGVRPDRRHPFRRARARNRPTGARRRSRRVRAGARKKHP